MLRHLALTARRFSFQVNKPLAMPWMQYLPKVPLQQPLPLTAPQTYDLWPQPVEEEGFDESKPDQPTLECIKTQKRRDLKMKKHRRQKRKKVMLLKLKASGKI